MMHSSCMANLWKNRQQLFLRIMFLTGANQVYISLHTIVIDSPIEVTQNPNLGVLTQIEVSLIEGKCHIHHCQVKKTGQRPGQTDRQTEYYSLCLYPGSFFYYYLPGS